MDLWRSSKEQFLKETAPANSKAGKWLENWRITVRATDWKSIDHVRKTYPTADPVKVESGRSVTVLNVCGNDYRLLAAKRQLTDRRTNVMQHNHKILTTDAFKRAASFLKTHARRLEVARFGTIFENSRDNDLLNELKNFQNVDGGLEKSVSLNLDYEIEEQEHDGSWTPTWSWGDRYPEAWAEAKREWTGVLTLEKLLKFNRFHRIQT